MHFFKLLQFRATLPINSHLNLIMPKVLIKKSLHYANPVVTIHYHHSPELKEAMRKVTDVRWSKTLCSWYAPRREGIVKEIIDAFSGLAQVDAPDFGINMAPATIEPDLPSVHQRPRAVPHYLAQLAPLSPENSAHVERLREFMLSRRYSANTIGTYTDALSVFLRYFHDKSVEDISEADLVTFNNRYIHDHRLSSSYQNQVVNAVKLFFAALEKKKLQPELIHRPRREKKLPNVLSKEEVKAILGSLNNVKHRLMLSVIYSCGLRCGELLRLLPDHVDEDRKLLVIKQAKGRKDRIVPLSEKIAVMIREYKIIHKPQRYLFEGQRRGEQYDERSLQQVLRHAVERAGISKPVTLHWLRHSYATHLLESGTDLRYIQEILGHSSSRTTEIYTHVSNRFIQQIISPFDTL
jgi:integrase/recombinase XerD